MRPVIVLMVLPVLIRTIAAAQETSLPPASDGRPSISCTGYDSQTRYFCYRYSMLQPRYWDTRAPAGTVEVSFEQWRKGKLLVRVYVRKDSGFLEETFPVRVKPKNLKDLGKFAAELSEDVGSAVAALLFR